MDTVKDIVYMYLKEQNAAGLVSAGGDCSCLLCDLGPCLSGIQDTCMPGYAHPQDMHRLTTTPPDAP